MMMRMGRNRPAGFSLVELMMAIMVVGILMSMVMFAMSTAFETARRDRTQSIIRRLHELIMDRYEQYETRRVPVGKNTNLNRLSTPDLDARVAVKDRVDRIREMMRMEMPDRMTDILDTPVQLPAGPKLWFQYRRVVQAQTNATEEYESAECLYMIVASMEDGDRNALEFFTPREIGDKDNDGLKEIWDAWGNPIAFLRWAPGMRSKIQITTQDLLEGVVATGNDVPDDPVDVLGIYRGSDPNKPQSYALIPLIVSAGPDEAFDLAFDTDPKLRYRAINNNPFLNMLGTVQDTNNNSLNESIDNISNHSLLSN